MKKNPDVFISYKREDQDTANLVKVTLEAQGLTVWWDEKLQTGKKWEEAIDLALISARVVVVLWSNLAVNSDWVKHEASFAKLHKNLVQAKINNCSIPAPFSTILAADLSNWNKRKDDPNFHEIISEIERIRNLSNNQNANISTSKWWLLVISYFLGLISIILLLRDPLICNLRFIKCQNKISKNVIADFKGSNGTGALNSFGLPFSMMSDSSQNMKSKIWYQRVHRDGQQEGFLRIYYQIEPHLDHDGYVGIYSDFTLPPAVPVSLSKYNGVRLKMRINQEIGVHPEIRIVMYSDNIKNPEFAYPIALVKPTKQWNEYNIPFSQFEPPPFAFTPVELDVERVFRFAFVLVSSYEIHGHVDIDDIELF